MKSSLFLYKQDSLHLEKQVCSLLSICHQAPTRLSSKDEKKGWSYRLGSPSSSANRCRQFNYQCRNVRAIGVLAVQIMEGVYYAPQFRWQNGKRNTWLMELHMGTSTAQHNCHTSLARPDELRAQNWPSDNKSTQHVWFLVGKKASGDKNHKPFEPFQKVVLGL